MDTDANVKINLSCILLRVPSVSCFNYTGYRYCVTSVIIDLAHAHDICLRHFEFASMSY